MKLIKDKAWDIPIVGMIAVLFMGAFLLDGGNKRQDLTMSVNPHYAAVSEGDMLTLGVFLNNPGVEEVTVVDIIVDFDKDNLSLFSVKPGGFFKEPLIVEWDEEVGRFSMAINPKYLSSNRRVNPNSSLIDIEFLALKSSDKVVAGVSPESQVYLYKKGVVSPETVIGSYEVKVYER